MAEDDNGTGKKRGKLRTIIIVILAVILALGLSVAGTLWFLSASDNGADSEDGKQAEVHTPASYYELDEPLTVSVSADQQRYLQAHVAFAMRGHDVSAALQRHLPTIRSRLRSLLQEKPFAQLQSRKGKEKLLQEMRDVVNNVLETEIEAEGGQSIEQVLFTNFVMQ